MPLDLADFAYCMLKTLKRFPAGSAAVAWAIGVSLLSLLLIIFLLLVLRVAFPPIALAELVLIARRRGRQELPPAGEPNVSKWKWNQPGLYEPGVNSLGSHCAEVFFRMKHRCSHRIRESRSRRCVEVFLRRADGREIKTLLTNISNHGCRLRPREELAIDEQIRIEVPRLGSIAATVRWKQDGYAGAEFIPQSDVWEEIANAGAQLFQSGPVGNC